MSNAIKQVVWGLYENHPGASGKLVGVFSTIELAKNCALIQPLLQEDWQSFELGRGEVLWRATAINSNDAPPETFHFTVEEIQVDRLVE